MSMIAKGSIVASVRPLGCFFFLLPNYMHVDAIIMQPFSHFDKRVVLQQEYSQPPILPSTHFLWVVKAEKYTYTSLRFDGSCTLGAAMVPPAQPTQGDKLDPSTTGKQLKPHYLLPLADRQPRLIR